MVSVIYLEEPEVQSFDCLFNITCLCQKGGCLVVWLASTNKIFFLEHAELRIIILRRRKGVGVLSPGCYRYKGAVTPLGTNKSTVS